MMFKNRQEAGQLLVKKLGQDNTITHPDKTVVLGITRGGVVLASVIARHFGLKLDIIIVKKLSAPNDPELAIGAIGETAGSRYVDKHITKGLRVNKAYLTQEIERKLEEIKKREANYRQGRKAIALSGRDVVVVDDGTATGATMIAACREVWNSSPRRVIAALPIAPLDTYKKLEKEADSVIILTTPEPFFAVGQFYQEFPQLTDEEVMSYLNQNPQLKIEDSD